MRQVDRNVLALRVALQHALQRELATNTAFLVSTVTQNAASAILVLGRHSATWLSMEDFDFVKAWNDALIKKAMNETSLDSMAARLPPEGQAWLNGLNRFCRWAVEYDLRNAGPEQFLEHWKSLRDTLEMLEREFGPSDEWK